ncbi:MAG: circularly permuted type 2 ATP-grasp protein, partial [Planctomycetota bacterium]|nr:circularly permuted type 2 ATP-grasp protein [Planctomycetota bacterium]
LDLVLKDVHGPQNLLKRGLLPPELLFSHAGFLRPLHGQMPVSGRFLHLYAADLARSPDGRWWVASDRTEDPSGAGYALENRIVLSRVLPEVFHESEVRRLASYFMALQQHLKQLAPQRDNPFVVLLSPGPGTANFFEDVYLARYLGFTLVQGADLGVRDDKVVLKTLGGLTPVDVIVRRVESPFCDPLELVGGSLAGVTGLLQAVRKGTVVVANALGSGFAQAPAVMAFLEPLCRALFGEELKIPSVATWWCGGERERKYVLSHLDTLVIRDAFQKRKHDPVRPWLLSSKERDELVASIKRRPYHFVGQETVQRSCAPVSVGGRCEPWSVALRTFLVTSGDSYDVMPGGLARVARSPETLDVTVSAGEGSKDAWVLSDEPVRPVSLLRQKSERIELRRSGSELPSRVADNLYWLGRHVARADGAARLLRTLIGRLATESESAEVPERQLLLRCAAAVGQIDYRTITNDTPIESTLPAMVLDELRPSSLRSQLATMYRTAWTVRDRLSFDAWRIVSRIAGDFPEADGGPLGFNELLPPLNRTVVDLAAFSGLVADSMTRSQGWRFLDIGRRLEHALHVTRLLSAAAPDLGRDEASVLESLLDAGDSLMTYRSRYMANLQAAAVLDLLLTDDTNPRSVAFQLETLVRHLDNLPHDDRQAGLRTEQRQAMGLLYAVRNLDVLSLDPNPGRDGELNGLLQQLAYGLPELSEAITHRYLHHSGVSRQFADLRPGV